MSKHQPIENRGASSESETKLPWSQAEDARAEKSLVYARLEFLIKNLELRQHAALFLTRLDSSGTLQTTYTSMESAGASHDSLFVAINLFSSGPHLPEKPPQPNGRRAIEHRLGMTAFRVDMAHKQTVMWPLNEATKDTACSKWVIPVEGGPYLQNFGSLLSIQHWHDDRLILPERAAPNGSERSVLQTAHAAQLADFLGAVMPYEQMDFSLL